MARLLITGGAGFIGANFVHYWLATRPDDRVVVLDALTYAGNRASLATVEDHPSFRFVEGDIRDEALVEGLLRDEALDTIVHFAAETHVDRSIHAPDAFVSTNIVGTHSLLKVASAVWLADGGRPHRFHHVSTDEVYGTLQADDPAFQETTPYQPNSPYAASKAASDHLVRAYQETYGLRTTISNCSNNYGPYQYPEKLIPLMLLNILAGRPLPIYGQGINVRDWLHVEDHCRAIGLVLDHGVEGRVYNVGTRNERRNIDLVHALCAELDARFAADPALAERFPDAPAARGGAASDLITFVSDRAGHDLRYAIAPDRLESELGFQATHGFTEGLTATIDWYLGNEDWWRPLLGPAFQDWINTRYGKTAGTVA